MHNKICEILNIEKPILQGPMSWVSTAPLVAAVSSAGGFGILGTAMATPDFITEQMQAVKAQTDKPFGFNMAFHPDFLTEEYFNDVMAVVRVEKPAAVHLDTMRNKTRHFDLAFAKKYFDQFHEAGLKIITKVFSMQDALLAEQAGTDIIIVKGWEGGGHITEQTTIVLVSQARDILSVPIIASGGIADGRAMAAVMMLGADGIEMGTVFLAALETAIHPNAKAAILQAGDMSTVITGSCADESCRQLRNSLAEQVNAIEKEYPAAEAAQRIQPLVFRSGRTAMQIGDIEQGAIMAGQIVATIDSIRPVQDIIENVYSQCQKFLLNAHDIVLQ